MIANTTPDTEGWGDFVTLSENGRVLFTCIGSTCPNPSSPSTKLIWRSSYGWISAGLYSVETIDHPKYGRCVLVNGGGQVKSRIPNINHNGKKILTEILIHVGNRGSINPQWRGSAGCPTIPPLQWENFIEALPDGKGLLYIKDGALNGVSV